MFKQENELVLCENLLLITCVFSYQKVKYYHANHTAGMKNVTNILAFKVRFCAY